MFNSHIINLKHLNEGDTYGQTLWNAFQVFLAALLDVKSIYKTAREGPKINRAHSINEMYSLAKQFDATMPNQAAELRYLASRDSTEFDEQFNKNNTCSA